ncbi:hypothetical protein HBA54_07540 [Pelagibius litoralis]|uniref:Uncharacterized protein n=1 Tax=Pelagibius litoralis TaxID=374515 RepID=A0A967CBL7_9PROT|nr:hypothetical protein [Pelagibius litoralis]NIA68443.1 hypothetical protein [Pelagibius litoralis]
MSNDEKEHSEFLDEYLDLPDDPEVAFAVLHQRRHEAMEKQWDNDRVQSWYYERRYVDTLTAFDEVHNLGILIAYRNPPKKDSEFADFFQDFRRNAEIASQKIMMEAARRLKIGSQNTIVLDAAARETIHTLINAIRGKLNELSMPENKRESLFAKLNMFAAEVDRNRTRTEAFYAFAIETARAAREVNEELKPLQKTIDRVFDWIEKAKKVGDVLPPWEERKKIEGPQKNLPKPQEDLDDEIPF